MSWVGGPTQDWLDTLQEKWWSVFFVGLHRKQNPK